MSSNKTGKNKGANVNSPKNPTILNMLQPSANEMLTQIKSQLDQEMGSLKTTMLDINKTLQQMNLTLSKSMERITGLESKVSLVEKRITAHEEELIKREMELASCTIRIQNVKYVKGENLYDIAADILAPLANLTKEEMLREFHLVHRAHTGFTRSHNQVPELIIKCVRRAMRDYIFKDPDINKCEYNGNKLVILKEVPWRIRQRRKAYKDLTKRLHKCAISFRWLIPEGVQFVFNNKTIKLDSMQKAQDFLKVHSEELEQMEEDAEKEEGETSMEEEGGGGGVLTRLQAREKEKDGNKVENWKTERGKVVN